MDETTRRRAQKKATAMQHFVGYPDELLDDKLIATYYQDLTLDADKYLVSVLRLGVFTYDIAYNKLFEEVDKRDWKAHAAVTVANAFYSFNENSVECPAGILQGVFFDAKYPMYMNYGAVGCLLGHEMSHGFDDGGSQFDEDGNLVDWWGETTKALFLEKAKCIIEQYGNYTVKEVNAKLNGVNTQGENIADNAGIKQSYQAYDKWVLQNGDEPPLPGLDYTSKQMFWISAANSFCTKYRPEYLKDLIITDPHAPEMVRVIVPFSNMEDFAVDFQCPLGSPMNPLHKCQVW